LIRVSQRQRADGALHFLRIVNARQHRFQQVVHLAAFKLNERAGPGEAGFQRKASEGVGFRAGVG